MLSHVSQTHDVIMTIYKTISSLEVQLAAARAAQADNSNEGSPVVMKPGTEQFKKCPKRFSLLWETLLHLAVESEGTRLETHGCLKNHVEGNHELSSKTKIYFSTAFANGLLTYLSKLMMVLT